MKAISKSLMKIFIATFLVALALNINQIRFTNSSLADKEKSSTNSFSAGTWREDGSRFQAENILDLDQKIIEEEKNLEDIEAFGTEITAPDPEMTIRTFEITLTGELNVPDGFAADTVLILKTINLSGDKKVIDALKNLEINMADIKIEKAGEIDILVSDLKIPAGADLTSAKNDDVVLEIIVSEKAKEENPTEVISTP